MELLHIWSRERGYFLRREAIEVGVDDRQLVAGVRRQSLVRIRQGAYCSAERWHELSDRDRHLARAMASYDLARGEVALSHTSALVAMGAPLYRPDLDLVHLSRRDRGSARIEAGVIHHVGALPDSDVVELDSMWMTTPSRTAVDALGLMTIESGMVTGDWLMNRGLIDFETVWLLKMLHDHWPHTRRLELVLRLLSGLAESPLESRVRYLCWRLGVPMPTLQHEIYDGSRFVAKTDFAWLDVNVFGEADGKVKYGRLLKPGQSPGDVVFAEKQREDDIRRVTGGTVVRWTHADVRPDSAPTRQLVDLVRRPA